MIKKILATFVLIPINFVVASQYLPSEWCIVTGHLHSITPHYHMLTVRCQVEREIVCINPPSHAFSYVQNEYLDNERPSNQIIVPGEKRTYLTPGIIDKLLGFFVKMNREPKAISSFLEDLKIRHISLPSFDAWDKALESIILRNDYNTIIDHIENFEYLPEKDKNSLSQKALTLLEKQSTSESTSMNSQQDIKTRFPGLFSLPRENFL